MQETDGERAKRAGDGMFVRTVFKSIRKDLELLETQLLEAVQSPVERITEIGEHLARAGGKRLRPALFLLAARSGAHFDLQRAMPLAVAVELIHMASLVHDDVLDHAGTRRGTPTANAKWGNQQAILAGDYLFARAFALIAGRGYGERISVLLSQLIMDLSAGEIVQNQELYQPPRSLARYYERIARKTANFLADCCEMGANVAELSEAETEGLRRYGKAVGMAFQITDDLLDLLADPKKIGKPAGNDLREGIVTLPVLRALEVSPEKDELLAIVTNPAMSSADVTQAIAMTKATDAVHYAEAQAKAFLSEAKEALPSTLPKDILRTYRQAADYIAKREF